MKTARLIPYLSGCNPLYCRLSRPEHALLTENVWRHHVRDGWLDHIKAVSKKTLKNCRPTKNAQYAARPPADAPSGRNLPC